VPVHVLVHKELVMVTVERVGVVEQERLGQEALKLTVMVELWVAEKEGAWEPVGVGVSVKEADSGSVGVLRVGDRLKLLVRVHDGV